MSRELRVAVWRVPDSSQGKKGNDIACGRFGLIDAFVEFVALANLQPHLAPVQCASSMLQVNP